MLCEEEKEEGKFLPERCYIADIYAEAWRGRRRTYRYLLNIYECGGKTPTGQRPSCCIRLQSFWRYTPKTFASSFIRHSRLGNLDSSFINFIRHSIFVGTEMSGGCEKIQYFSRERKEAVEHQLKVKQNLHKPSANSLWRYFDREKKSLELKRLEK